MPDIVEELQPVARQAVGARPLAQQGQVTQRRAAIGLVAARDIGDDGERAAGAVLGLKPLGPVAASWNTLARIESKQVAAGYLVQHAPHLRLGIRCQIGRRRPPLWPALEVEAEAIAADAADALIDRPHAAALPKGAVVHVGAVGEVPDV